MKNQLFIFAKFLLFGIWFATILFLWSLGGSLMTAPSDAAVAAGFLIFALNVVLIWNLIKFMYKALVSIYVELNKTRRTIKKIVEVEKKKDVKKVVEEPVVDKTKRRKK